MIRLFYEVLFVWVNFSRTEVICTDMTLTGVRQRNLTILTNTTKALQIPVQTRQKRVHFSKRD